MICFKISNKRWEREHSLSQCLFENIINCGKITIPKILTPSILKQLLMKQIVQAKI